MKVYPVWHGDYDDSHIVQTFSTEELAKEYCDKLGCGLRYTTLEINDDAIELARKWEGHEMYTVHLYADSTEQDIWEGVFQTGYEEPTSEKITVEANEGWLELRMWVKDREEAIEIAKEEFRKWNKDLKE